MPDIAFRPQTGTFAVPDATTERDPEYIVDISEVFAQSTSKCIREYLKRLKAARDVSDDETELVESAIERLASLTNFPFIALELSQQCSEEQVADVFVRINSEGKKLNQSDFILTLMSVFWDEGRTELETFCRAARQPGLAGQPSPFNAIFQPDPDHLLRVDVGVAFRRARLEHVYSLLRGKDLTTGESNPENRAKQFDKLRDAQSSVLNLTYWADFLNIVRAAGYRNAKHISSGGATTNGTGGWPISAGNGCSSSGASGSWLKRTNHSAASRRARVLAPPLGRSFAGSCGPASRGAADAPQERVFGTRSSRGG
ncbi:MAG: hypothetical protein M9929_09980 [Burkholderiaceae bacterium]|nr:hypothetical protein [Burkholderiaceae bacterium]